MKFLGSEMSGEDFATELERAERGAARTKQYISLACESGRAVFAKPISESPCCSQLLAAYQTVHGATASHFAQTYFASLLLEGHTAKTAYRHAASAVRGETHFRLWVNGRIVAGRRM